VRQDTKENIFCKWTWETISKLHLHPVDQEQDICRKALSGIPDVYLRLKKPDTDEDLKFIPEGVSQKKPMACFVSLSVTHAGVSIPDICLNGFEHLKILAQAQRFGHVMEVLNNMVPLFLSAPSSLVVEAVFIEVIGLILAADETLFNMAKNMVSDGFPGPTTRNFANAVSKQLQSYSR
jgi:hypothetical protein